MSEFGAARWKKQKQKKTAIAAIATIAAITITANTINKKLSSVLLSTSVNHPDFVKHLSKTKKKWTNILIKRPET